MIHKVLTVRDLAPADYLCCLRAVYRKTLRELRTGELARRAAREGGPLRRFHRRRIRAFEAACRSIRSPRPDSPAMLPATRAADRASRGLL